MGNQSGKEDINITGGGAELTDPQHDKLERSFESLQKLSTCSESQPSITLNDFKTLFHQNEHLGELLFKQESKEADIMSRSQFLTLGSHILSMTSFQDQMDYYLAAFTSGKNSITTQDLEGLLSTCTSVALSSTILAEKLNLQQDPVVASMKKSLFTSGDVVEKSDFVYWMGRHCPRLLHCVHPYVTTRLCSAHPNMGEATSLGDLMQHILDDHYLVSLTVLWAINTYIPLSYTSMVETQGTAMDLIHTVTLTDIVGPEGWQLLYDSNSQGLSLNRFEHHVMSYAAATLTVIQFEGHLYCIGADSEWKERIDRWGGQDCFLLQILPQYRVIQAGPGMLYLNIQDRKFPKGMYIGKDSRSTMLQIDCDFSKVKHYGIDVPLQRIEVWGCGKKRTHEAQLEQRKWETQEANRHKNRKLKVDDWKDNPDRELLNMGGIQTEHAER